MSAWTEFYKKRVGNRSYMQYFLERYHPFLDVIRSMDESRLTYPANRYLIEAGCGIAMVTKALKRSYGMKERWFACIDKEVDMLTMARQNIGYRGPRAANIHLDAFDVTKLGFVQWMLQQGLYASVAFSHGLLEHLTDEEIRATIFGLSHKTTRQVHYVPGKKYSKPSFGDERLMSVEDWQRIARPKEIRTFNDGFDYLLLWY